LSLTIRKEHRLKVFENRVLRRIFSPKRDEVTGEWKELNNVRLNGLYSSPNIVRMIKSRIMKCARHVARMGQRRGVYRILVGKRERNISLGRPRCV
jgi:hypothetical protein